LRWTNALSAAAHCSGRIDATASQTRARLPCRTAPLTSIKLYFSIDIIRFFADFVNCGKTKNPLLRVKIFISDFNGLRKNSRRPSKAPSVGFEESSLFKKIRKKILHISTKTLDMTK